MKLGVPVFLNCFFVIFFYLLERKTKFNKLPTWAKQIIIGLVFGGVSAFASGYGVEILGTFANVRDAAPLSAGFIFGGPAGIISGFVGGIYRWFSVYWGAGEYTRIACTFSTILVGFIAAGLRKYMFDNKKPTWGYGIAITVVCEVIHMLMIFITNMDDSSYAFEFVKGATIPMIIGNSVAVGVSLIMVSLLSREGLRKKKSSEHISQTFQRWLLVLIVVAYLATSTFTYFLQNGMTEIETREIFVSAINDVIADVEGKSDDTMLILTKKIRKAYLEDKTRPLEDIAREFDVAEINIVNRDGLITASTEEGLAGSFNMSSTSQSKEFMVLTTGEEIEYVQQYMPVGSDGVTMRKFAGVALSDRGFVQVGYDSTQFHNMLDDFVIDVTKNRHVGSGGFVAVCDENLRLVADTDRHGDHISTIGIVPNEEMLARRSSTELYETNITNGKTGFNKEYIYVFTFVEGYCIIAAMPKADAMFMRDASMYTSLFMLILIFAALFVFIYFLIKKVIINNLRKVNGTLSQISEGNLNVTVDVRSNAEFSSLSDDINSTVTTLKRYISEAATRIDKELEYAKQIQLSALPANFPDNEKYRIYARMIAAKEVGGDFYDFYKLDEKTVAILVADVSGKGIPAAMFMMTAKTIIKDLAERRLAVNEIFNQANEKLCENNESGMFVTAWMGILDLETGKLQFANAGHNPPLVLQSNGEFRYLKTRAGFVLAGMEGIRYRLEELQLSPGDRIFLYTDGVTEATDINETLYGEDRLLSYVNSHKSAEAKDMLHGIKENIDAFVGSAPQFDDITMLIFDYGRKVDCMEKRVFPANKEALSDVMSFTEESLEQYGCSLKTTTMVSVAIEEIFVNVANYAYGDGTGDVEYSIGYDENRKQLTFIVEDMGTPFNPLEKPDPDITLPAEERDIGGLGIFITKKTMDSITYSYENGKNILTMIKNI